MEKEKSPVMHAREREWWVLIAMLKERKKNEWRVV